MTERGVRAGAEDEADADFDRLPCWRHERCSASDPVGTELKDLAMKTSCTFELLDICGTSYAPFPLDAPKFMHRAQSTKLLSSLGSHDRCSAIPSHPQERPGCASTECIFACLSRSPTSAIA